MNSHRPGGWAGTQRGPGVGRPPGHCRCILVTVMGDKRGSGPFPAHPPHSQLPGAEAEGRERSPAGRETAAPPGGSVTGKRFPRPEVRGRAACASEAPPCGTRARAVRSPAFGHETSPRASSPQGRVVQEQGARASVQGEQKFSVRKMYKTLVWGPHSGTEFLQLNWKIFECGLWMLFSLAPSQMPTHVSSPALRPP